MKFKMTDQKWPLYEQIFDILSSPVVNNLWCTNYLSVRTNTRFTVRQFSCVLMQQKYDEFW